MRIPFAATNISCRTLDVFPSIKRFASNQHRSVALPVKGLRIDRDLPVSKQQCQVLAQLRCPGWSRARSAFGPQQIEAGRRLFPAIWFNAETCSPGIDALGWYHEKHDEARNIGLGPEHDWSSHGADALGLMCVAYEEPEKRPLLFPKRDMRWVV
jgi:hypothetical protein